MDNDATVTIQIDDRTRLLRDHEKELVNTATFIGKKSTKILEELWPIYSQLLYQVDNYETFLDYCRESGIRQAYIDAGCGDYFWDMVQVVNVVLRYVRVREITTICPVTGMDLGLLVTDDGEFISAPWLIKQPKMIGKLIAIVPRIRNEQKTYAERDSYVLAALGIVRPALVEAVEETLTDEETGEPTDEAEEEYGLIPMSVRVNEDGTYNAFFTAITAAEMNQIRRALRDLVEETLE